MRHGSVNGGVQFSHFDLSLQGGGGLGPLGHESLAVSAPRGVELDEPGVLALQDQFVEVLVGQNDDVVLVDGAGVLAASAASASAGRASASAAGGASSAAAAAALASGVVAASSRGFLAQSGVCEGLGLVQTSGDDVVGRSSSVVVAGGVLVQAEELQGGVPAN